MMTGSKGSEALRVKQKRDDVFTDQYVKPSLPITNLVNHYMFVKQDSEVSVDPFAEFGFLAVEGSPSSHNQGIKDVQVSEIRFQTH